MANISFSMFVQMLHRYLSGGMSGYGFTRFLFNLVTDYEDFENSPAKRSDESFKKYFAGSVSIKSYVKRIREHIVMDDFVSWLYQANETESEKLREELADYLPTSVTYDFPEACAKLFRSILDNPDPASEDTTIQTTASLQFELTYELETEASMLRDECSNKCLLCGKRLKKWTKVQIIPPKLGYKERVALRKAVVQLCDESLVPDFDGEFDYSSPDNNALLTVDCAADYRSKFTIEKCAELMVNKLKAKQSYAAQLIMDSIDLDDALRELLDSLDELIDPKAVEELRYKPKKIEEKIDPKSHVLKSEIDDRVNRYYGFIQEELGRRDGNDEFDSDDLCHSIKKCYKKLNKAGETQDHIYDMMAHWVSESTGASNLAACRVFIAFFVQNCEVFDAIPE